LVLRAFEVLMVGAAFQVCQLIRLKVVDLYVQGDESNVTAVRVSKENLRIQVEVIFERLID
jgi:hypothetical protein